MIKIRVDDYINQLKGFHSNKVEENDLARELYHLQKHSYIFDKLHKEASSIHSRILEHHGFSDIIKFKSLASHIKKKKEINQKLLVLYSNAVNLLNDNLDPKSIPGAVNSYIKNEKHGFVPIIDQLNDFKKKLDELKNHNFNPKGLDSRLVLAKRQGHIEDLYLILNKQKQLFRAIALMLVLNAKKHIISAKKNFTTRKK